MNSPMRAVRGLCWLAFALGTTAALMHTTRAQAQNPAPGAVSAAASAPAVVTEPTVNTLKRRGTILIGHREAALPFSFVVDGRPRGYAIDLCLRVVEGLRRRLDLPNLQVRFVQLQAAERLPAVISGRVDMECGNTTANAERRKSVSFTTPTFIAGAGVLVRADVAGAKRTGALLRELRGRRVVVASSTTGEKILRRANEALYGLEPLIVKDNAEAFAALESNRADAWITDDVLLAAYRAQAKDPSRYLLLDKRHTIEPLALMHRKNDPVFERAVDAEVGALFRSGQVEQLYQRWFQQPIPPRDVNLDLPPSRLLREIFRMPMKMQHEVDVIVL
jgi:ABC-type amino acid transport substrate-binding protein